MRSLAAVALVLLAARAAAQEVRDPRAVQPERPTVATHAGTVETGWLEIEAGVERDRLGGSPATLSTPTVFKLGLAERAQLSILATTLHAGSTTRFGDLAAGVKWRVLEDAMVLGDFALLPTVKIPTGDSDSGAGTGTTDVSLLAISSHALGPVALDVNVGYTRRSGDGSRAPRDASLWTISFGGPIVSRLGWVGECYGYPGTSGPNGQAPIVAVLGGPTFLIRPWLALDAGFIGRVSGPQPRALYAGTVYNVGRLWRARH
ncbi:MAG TPA: transporter [Gemmatimonadaceae bacterium]|nr:transporter [Gemmatimonadaceae bacterium]